MEPQQQCLGSTAHLTAPGGPGEDALVLQGRRRGQRGTCTGCQRHQTAREPGACTPPPTPRPPPPHTHTHTHTDAHLQLLLRQLVLDDHVVGVRRHSLAVHLIGTHAQHQHPPACTAAASGGVAAPSWPWGLPGRPGGCCPACGGLKHPWASRAAARHTHPPTQRTHLHGAQRAAGRAALELRAVRCCCAVVASPMCVLCLSDSWT
jgi:hypothetical protein